MSNGWEKVPWDGNLSLGFKCWRKKFGRGHVSVGCGDFHSIVHSFGANSDGSYSSTRWRNHRILTEQEAMDLVDTQYSKEK